MLNIKPILQRAWGVSSKSSPWKPHLSPHTAVRTCYAQGSVVNAKKGEGGGKAGDGKAGDGKGSGGKGSGGKGGGAGRGQGPGNGAGWPSTNDNPSGGGRSNSPSK